MSTAQPENAGAATPGPRILLYSDDVDARAQVRLAVGRRLRRGAPDIEWVEVATAAAVIAQAESGGLDLLILDGEADKVGGLGLAPPAQGRGLPVPADPRAHRSPAGRLARVLVERRRRRQPPARPGRAARRRRGDRRVAGRHPMTDATAPRPTWPDLFATLAARQDLSTEQTSWAMSEIMSGAASTPKIAAFLLGAARPRASPSTSSRALADTMLAHAVRIEVPGRTLDIVGTGGDRSHTVNISTMSALVIAGAGITVVKHGNRAASSSSGSADVLEALGIRLDHPPARVAELATEVGHHLLLRAGVPPVVPAHRGRAHRAGHRDGVQLPRSAHQPGAAAVRGDRRRGRADGAAHGRRARRARGAARSCSAARTASTRSPRPVPRGSGRCGTATSRSR